MKVLDKDVAIHNLKQEMAVAETRKEVNMILGLINLLEADKIEAFRSEHGIETYYRFKPGKDGRLNIGERVPKR